MEKQKKMSKEEKDHEIKFFKKFKTKRDLPVSGEKDVIYFVREIEKYFRYNGVCYIEI